MNEIANLTAYGGGDAPEPSIGAIIRAIRASEEGSPIFIFTDAPPSDSYRQSEAKALISQKSVSITFVYVTSFRKRSNSPQFENFRSKRQIANNTYDALAAISGGQVLSVGTDDISRLSDLVSFFTNPERSVVVRYSGVVSDPTAYNFTVDSSIEQVIISIDGNGYLLSLTTPAGDY